MIDDLRERVPSIVLEVERRLCRFLPVRFRLFALWRKEATCRARPFAAQIAAVDLGQFLRPAMDAFPRRAYLTSDPDRTTALRARLAGDGAKVVGLSWRSVNAALGRNKSAQLADFNSLFRVPGIRFVDLQYGDTAAERDAAERELGVKVAHLDDVDNTNDIEGLAALLSACDAVVTVSNTTAHLAGALGGRPGCSCPTALPGFGIGSRT